MREVEPSAGNQESLQKRRQEMTRSQCCGDHARATPTRRGSNFALNPGTAPGSNTGSSPRSPSRVLNGSRIGGARDLGSCEGVAGLVVSRRIVGSDDLATKSTQRRDCAGRQIMGLSSHHPQPPKEQADHRECQDNAGEKSKDHPDDRADTRLEAMSQLTALDQFRRYRPERRGRSEAREDRRRGRPPHRPTPPRPPTRCRRIS